MIAHMDGGVHRRSASSRLDRGDPDSSDLSLDVLERALTRCQDQLLSIQHADGYWCGELEGDSILESEYILLMAFLGRERDDVCIKAAKYLHEHQLPDGGWTMYPGGPVDLSASVKAYFALKLVGLAVTHPAMVKAREVILTHGGAQACNSFTRFYLALLGQISYDDTPTVPVELMHLPKSTPFGLYAMSSWTRKMVVTLSIISAKKPVRHVPENLGIAELFREDLPRQMSRWKRPFVCWSNFFLGVDKVLKLYEKVVPTSWREPAIKKAHRWILDHCENSDGLGAIFPPMIYTVIVLKALGYDDHSTMMRWALDQLEDFIIEEDGTVRLQPCVSPVWDTAIGAIAMADSGLPDFHPALMRSVRWLLTKEVRRPGDWSVRLPHIEPSGWYFEFNNERFPDIDDTAMVLLALQKSALADDPVVRAATDRAVNWMLAFQNRDGGFAAFDVNIDNEILTKVPFADHNAMLDPSCADITARVIESLGTLGYRGSHPAIAKALQFLWKTQEPEGCWYGRWGVNYIYGTWQVLLGLQAIDFSMTHPAVTRAADWLESVQQSCGGWGESCHSYDDPSTKGQGTPTASQTAWAVLGLIAAGRADSSSVHRGIRYLVDTQNADGTWSEAEFTGTGFPSVFYLRYHLYCIFFPLMALGRYKSATARLGRPISAPAIATRVPALPLWRDI
ncbi:MAG: squalene-hopene cyclase [Planctomycetota bacterium]|nr:squalene-hopene cyclase [Planctomycetota bacterium]